MDGFMHIRDNHSDRMQEFLHPELVKGDKQEDHVIEKAIKALVSVGKTELAKELKAWYLSDII